LNGTQHISQEDLALYSMQALTPAESAEIKAHLDTCASCRDALAEVLADVSLVGLSAPQRAIPQGARQRFMAAVENTSRSSNAAPLPAVPISSRTVRDERETVFPWFGWLGWAVATAALLVAIFFVYRDTLLQRQLENSRQQIAQLSTQTQHLNAQAQQLQKLMDALSSPEAKQVTLTETRRPAQPSGQVTYSQQSGALLLVASNLHALPQNKTYELWLIPANGKAPIPAGLFRPDAAGSASVVLPQLPVGVVAKAFGVTVEQANGSPTPTLPIVMAGS
jgi:hypothetical protein